MINASPVTVTRYSRLRYAQLRTDKHQIHTRFTDNKISIVRSAEGYEHKCLKIKLPHPPSALQPCKKRKCVANCRPILKLDNDIGYIQQGMS